MLVSSFLMAYLRSESTQEASTTSPNAPRPRISSKWYTCVMIGSDGSRPSLSESFRSGFSDGLSSAHSVVSLVGPWSSLG